MDLSQFESRPVVEVAAPPNAAPEVAIPPAASPVAASPVSAPPDPAAPGDQARFSKRVLERNTPPPKKKAKPNLLGGAERWGVRKALPDLSVHNVFLTSLTWRHKQILNHAHSWALQHLGLGASSAALLEATVNCFNSWHSSELGRVPGGCGGFVSKHLVSRFLKDLGRVAVGTQLDQRLEERLSKPPPVTEQQIDKMGRTELRRLAKSWSITQFKKTNDELKEALKKHLRKWP